MGGGVATGVPRRRLKDGMGASIEQGEFNTGMRNSTPRARTSMAVTKRERDSQPRGAGTGSKVGRNPVLFPVAVASGIGTLPATDLFGRRWMPGALRVGQAAPLLRLLPRLVCLRL